MNTALYYITALILLAIACIGISWWKARRRLRIPAPVGRYPSKEQAPDLNRHERRKYGAKFRKVIKQRGKAAGIALNR